MDHSELQAMLNQVRSNRGYRYFFKPLLSQTDQDMLNLTGALKAAPSQAESTSWIRSQLRNDDFFYFLGFAERMASWAVRTKQTRFLQEALIAMALVEGLSDAREIVLILSLIYDAAVRIQADPHDVFSSVDQYCAPGMRQLLSGYLNRDEKSILAMGYVFEAVGGGRYRRTW